MPMYEEARPKVPAVSAEAPDKGSLVRALHELEAAQARVTRNAQRLYDERRGELVLALLPVGDNLERVVHAVEKAGDPAVIDALRMVRAELEDVLVRYGAERLDADGQRFDPAFHEAVAPIAVLEPELVGTVVRQISPGYRFAGKLLRPAKVLVGVQSSPLRGRQVPVAVTRP